MLTNIKEDKQLIPKHGMFSKKNGITYVEEKCYLTSRWIILPVRLQNSISCTGGKFFTSADADAVNGRLKTVFSRSSP